MYKSLSFEMYFPIKDERNMFDNWIDSMVNIWQKESCDCFLTTDDYIEKIVNFVKENGFDVVYSSNNGTNEKAFIQSVVKWLFVWVR